MINFLEKGKTINEHYYVLEREAESRYALA